MEASEYLWRKLLEWLRVSSGQVREAFRLRTAVVALISSRKASPGVTFGFLLWKILGFR